MLVKAKASLKMTIQALFCPRKLLNVLKGKGVFKGYDKYP